MSQNEDRVSLHNLARGAVVERFDDAFASALDNILDPNTTLALSSRRGCRGLTMQPRI